MANEQDRDQVAELAEQVQWVTSGHVEVAFVDQGYTDEQAVEDAASQAIRLEVVKLPDAKCGFILLPKRWVVERSIAWLARFRRLARDYDGTLKSWPDCISLHLPFSRLPVLFTVLLLFYSA